MRGRVGGLAGDQPARTAGSQGQHSQQGASAVLGGGVPQGSQTLLELALVQGKAAGQRGAAVLAHGGQQGVGVGRTVSGIAATQGLGVTGLLNVAARAGGQQPDSRVIPMHGTRQRKQQLFADVMPFYVGQLVGQHVVCAIGSRARGGQKYGMQRARHHGAAYQRRGDHARARPLRQGTAPAGVNRLCGAADADAPDGIAAKLIERNSQHTEVPRKGQQVQPRCTDGEAFQHRAVSRLQLGAGHDVARGRSHVGHTVGGALGDFLRKGGPAVQRCGIHGHRRRGLGHKRVQWHQKQHSQRDPQAAEPLRAVAFLQPGRRGQQCQRGQTQQNALHEQRSKKCGEHGVDLLCSTVVEDSFILQV